MSAVGSKDFIKVDAGSFDLDSQERRLRAMMIPGAGRQRYASGDADTMFRKGAMVMSEKGGSRLRSFQ